jgi:hypothetical protein
MLRTLQKLNPQAASGVDGAGGRGSSVSVRQ